MGRHRKANRVPNDSNSRRNRVSRATGKSPRRRIAAWPLVALTILGLFVAGWFGWNWASDTLAYRAEIQAMECQEGEKTIHLAVTPEIERPIESAAKKWNAERTIVRGHCIHVDVYPAPAEEVLHVLLNHKSAEEIGGTPSAWVPDSSTWIEQLSEERPDLVSASSPSLASDSENDYPYLPLTEDVDDVQQRATQSFRKFLLKPTQQREFETGELQPAE